MFCAKVWLGTMAVKRMTPPRSNSYYEFNGTIYVENESPNKVVGIHFELGGVWQDLLASYSHLLLTGGGSRAEAWELSKSFNSSVVQSYIRLAVFYRNIDWDITHWDNNYGSDYFIPVTVS